MAIARFYVEDNNPDGASFPGVPLRNIEDAEWDAYPAFIQRSVDASDFYRKTNPKPATRQAQDKPAPEAPQRKDET